MLKVKDKIFELFIPESELTTRIEAIAQQINREYSGKNPLFVAVLNGAFMFTADLLKRISIPCEVSFIKVASYEAMQTTGQVKDLIGLTEEVKGRHVVLLEDIVDTGITMEKVLSSLEAKELASLKVAVLLFKPAALQRSLTLDYVGFEIPTRFVVGYGLDYDGLGRNLPAIYVLNEAREEAV